MICCARLLLGGEELGGGGGQEVLGEGGLAGVVQLDVWGHGGGGLLPLPRSGGLPEGGLGALRGGPAVGPVVLLVDYFDVPVDVEVGELAVCTVALPVMEEDGLPAHLIPVD